ncbi:MAG TPA: ATP-binding cassette domain-containing protein, partial [Candidatus Marinimicrobia bacterium]|nr:ATP-binding cassette domain-containing protein [Candidatus Neomarinimicrobiota bacterium]
MKNSHGVLTAENLHKQYGKRWVVRAVDIEVKKGEIVGLLGPNGAGKTTTFYMITGMIKPTKGRIFLDKKEITQDAMYKRSRQGIGYLAQEPSIFGKLSVEDNLKLVLEMTDLSKADQQEKIEQLLKGLTIQHLR